MTERISLHERVAEKMRKRRQGKTGGYFSSFLALRAQIGEALSKGWSLKAIWETLYEEGEITFKYVTFTRYAMKEFGEENIVVPRVSKKMTDTKAKTVGERKEEDSANKLEDVNKTDRYGFKYNPNHNLEDFN